MKPPFALLISSEIIQALCWTLVHSLWQGLVLAVLAGVVVQFTRTSSPALRYNLLTALLGLFLGGSGLTYWYAFEAPTIPIVTNYSGLSSFVSQTTLYNSSTTGCTPAITWVDAFIYFCNTNASIIVLLWFLVFAFKWVQIMSGIFYVSRLRKEKTSIIPSYWQNQIANLAQRLQIVFPVQLLESALVKTPVVIGFLKPLILVPTGMLAQLPTDQIEAILLHELAHIKRRDYLVNLLQTFAEAVFFFNPALIWLSKMIRQERENCCDDLAIQVLQNKSNFLQALVTFQEYSFNRYGLASGFSDTRTSLTDRVKRILYRNNTPLAKTEKWFVFGCLAITAALLLGITRPVLPITEVLPLKPLEVFLPIKKQLIISENKLLEKRTSKPKPKVESLVKRAVSKPLEKPLPAEVPMMEGTAHKSFNGKIATYQFLKGGILYEVERDSSTVLAVKVAGKVASPEEVMRYKDIMEALLQQYEQGAIKIVVNGKVPNVPLVQDIHPTEDPANTIHIAFLQNGTITTDRDSIEYEVKVKNHQLIQFKVNSRVVASSDFSKHVPLIQSLVKEAQDDRAFAELTVRAAEELYSANKRQSPELGPDTNSEFIDYQPLQDTYNQPYQAYTIYDPKLPDLRRNLFALPLM